MSDLYERDKGGNVTGKAGAEHPQPPSEPAPANNGRPVDKAPANSTMASRARGDNPKPMPAANPYGNSTLAERAKGTKRKAVKADATEDKSVSKAATKKG